MFDWITSTETERFLNNIHSLDRQIILGKRNVVKSFFIAIPCVAFYLLGFLTKSSFFDWPIVVHFIPLIPIVVYFYGVWSQKYSFNKMKLLCQEHEKNYPLYSLFDMFEKNDDVFSKQMIQFMAFENNAYMFISSRQRQLFFLTINEIDQYIKIISHIRYSLLKNMSWQYQQEGFV